MTNKTGAMGEVTVELVRSVTDDLTESIARLVPQLSSSAPPPTSAELAELVSSPGAVLFVASQQENEILGMLALVTYRIPTGIRAVIEDVVVEERARGAGAGAALVGAALAEAKRRGARHVDLTSRPGRRAANRLYLKLGFVQRETNVYRYGVELGA
ncbi:MAG: GNAT family N-acetyltransferase [Acidimicrobiales bacterium]